MFQIAAIRPTIWNPWNKNFAPDCTENLKLSPGNDVYAFESGLLAVLCAHMDQLFYSRSANHILELSDAAAHSPPPISLHSRVLTSTSAALYANWISPQYSATQHAHATSAHLSWASKIVLQLLSNPDISVCFNSCSSFGAYHAFTL